jgi:hypothetical protein
MFEPAGSWQGRIIALQQALWYTGGPQVHGKWCNFGRMAVACYVFRLWCRQQLC